MRPEKRAASDQGAGGVGLSAAAPHSEDSKGSDWVVASGSFYDHSLHLWSAGLEGP